MPSPAIETTERPAELPSVSDLMVALKTLHDRSYQKPDALRCTERIVRSLGQTNQELLRICSEYMAMQGKPADEITASIRERATRLLYHHFGYSTQNNPIKTLQFGQLLTKQHLEESVQGDERPEEALRKLGIVMIDVDGLKGVKECVGHYETNRFLQLLSQTLTNVNGAARQWAEQEQGIAVTPLVAGGDEFALLLKSGKQLDEGVLEELISRYETDVMEDAQLKGMVNFDNPSVLQSYAGMNLREKQAFAKLETDEQRKRLVEMRKSLPAEFTPSVSGGASTLQEGMRWAIEQEDDFRLALDEQDFEAAGAKAFQGMFHLAEDRQALRKAEYKRDVKTRDPVLHKFLTRTGAMVKLEEQVDAMRALLQELGPVLGSTLQRIEHLTNGNSAEEHGNEQAVL
jgi:GGDEF domain-containing protein